MKGLVDSRVAGKCAYSIAWRDPPRATHTPRRTRRATAGKHQISHLADGASTYQAQRRSQRTARVEAAPHCSIDAGQTSTDTFELTRTPEPPIGSRRRNPAAINGARFITKHFSVARVSRPARTFHFFFFCGTAGLGGTSAAGAADASPPCASGRSIWKLNAVVLAKLGARAEVPALSR